MAYALATRGWMLYAGMVVWSLSGLAGPALQGVMSRQVSEKEQGELQGALASVGSLTSIVAPLMLTNLFWYFTSPIAPAYLPGASSRCAVRCRLDLLRRRAGNLRRTKARARLSRPKRRS